MTTEDVNKMKMKITVQPLTNERIEELMNIEVDTLGEHMLISEVVAALHELKDLRAYFAHINQMMGPNLIPYSDPRVPEEAFDGDFMMIDGDVRAITGAPTRDEQAMTVEELAKAQPVVHQTKLDAGTGDLGPLSGVPAMEGR